jgi:hypothetical protein
MWFSWFKSTWSGRGIQKFPRTIISSSSGYNVEAASSPEDMMLAHLTAVHHNQLDKNTVHHNSLGFIKVENFLSRSISASFALWTLAPKTS